MKNVFVKLTVVCLLVVALPDKLMAQCTNEREVQFATGANFTLVLDDRGYLWAGGNNSSGQLGDGTTENKNKLVKIGTKKWKHIAAGYDYALGIQDDNSLWAWGNNQDGQLGDGTKTAVRNEPVQIGTSLNWKTVSAGKQHTIAVKTDGTLWVWGKNNNNGILGLGKDSKNKLAPVQLGLDKDWDQVSAGYEHSLAVKKDGVVWSWGRNIFAELGLGVGKCCKAMPFRNEPARTGTWKWKQVSAGQEGTLAISEENRLWGWGNHAATGQLGLGVNWNRYSDEPTELARHTRWQKVSLGHSFALAIKTDGTLWATGINTAGQLGDGTLEMKKLLVQIGKGVLWKNVSAGGSHVIALSNDNRLYSWGANESGQLLDGLFETKREAINLVGDICRLNRTDHYKNQKISIYPNPAHNRFTVDFGSLVFGEARITITNSLGQVVAQKKITGTATFPIEGAEGLYLVTIDFPDGAATQHKIIKQ